MSTNRSLVAQEPVAAVGLVVALVGATITLAIAFGVAITDEQRDALLAWVAVAAAIVAPIVTAWIARRKVTPTINGVVLVDGKSGEIVAGEASSQPTGMILEPGATVEDVAP
jgi:hypothetical protein